MRLVAGVADLAIVGAMPNAGEAPLVIAIDGPAGSGKSTVAREVAAKLGLRHIDTGAMYRAVTWRAMAEGIDPADETALVDLAERSEMSFGPRGIVVDGVPAERQVRTRSVTALVSQVSAHPELRRVLVARQRNLIDALPAVVEGRDVGSVVCPDAEVKVFLTASTTERARRRRRELASGGSNVGLGTLREEMRRRDTMDSGRPVSPLTIADDATLIDSTGRTVPEIVDEIIGLVRIVEKERD